MTASPVNVTGKGKGTSKGKGTGNSILRLGSNYADFELSSATLLPLDLVDNFLSFLNSVADNCRIADRILSIEEDLPVDEDDTEDLDWLLYEEIWPLLESIAPGGCWFGSHPGDGACFGFWSLDLLEG